MKKEMTHLLDNYDQLERWTFSFSAKKKITTFRHSKA